MMLSENRFTLFGIMFRYPSTSLYDSRTYAKSNSADVKGFTLPSADPPRKKSSDFRGYARQTGTHLRL